MAKKSSSVAARKRQSRSVAKNRPSKKRRPSGLKNKQVSTEASDRTPYQVSVFAAWEIGFLLTKLRYWLRQSLLITELGPEIDEVTEIFAQLKSKCWLLAREKADAIHLMTFVEHQHMAWRTEVASEDHADEQCWAIEFFKKFGESERCIEEQVRDVASSYFLRNDIYFSELQERIWSKCNQYQIELMAFAGFIAFPLYPIENDLLNYFDAASTNPSHAAQQVALAWGENPAVPRMPQYGFPDSPRRIAEDSRTSARWIESVKCKWNNLRLPEEIRPDLSANDLIEASILRVTEAIKQLFAIEQPPNPTNGRCRLRVDLTLCAVWIDDLSISVEEAEAIFLDKIIKGQREWTSFSDLRKEVINLEGKHPTRLLKKVPTAITSFIESRVGHGYRLKLSAFVTAIP